MSRLSADHKLSTLRSLPSSGLERPYIDGYGPRTAGDERIIATRREQIARDRKAIALPLFPLKGGATMRNFTPKVIAIASLLAAVPLSSAYAVHRHRVEPGGMSVEASAVLDQLQGVRQGIVEAMDAKAITPQQEHDLMMQADSIHRSATVAAHIELCSAR